MQPSTITSGLRDYYNGLSNTPSSADAESQLNQFNKMAPASTSILADYEKQAGVQGYQTESSNLHKNILDTENLINALPDAIATRTSNALVSGAQANRLVAAEQDPLSKQLTVLNSRYTGTQNDLQNAESQASKYATLDIGDIGTWRDSLSGRLTDALNREEQQRQAAQQAAQLKAVQDMIAAQNAQNAAAMARLTALSNAARQSYLTTQANYNNFVQSGALNPQKTISTSVLQPTVSVNYLQPAKNTVQVTAPSSSLQGGMLNGFNLNTSGGVGIPISGSLYGGGGIPIR